MCEESEIKPLTGVEIYNEDKSLTCEMFKLQREIATSIAPIYQNIVNDGGMESYKLKHLVLEAFDLLDNDIICGDSDSLDGLLNSISKFKHADEFFDDELDDEED